MIPCQFCKIFKNTFFIEHVRWLLLAILKPLDSQRQLCKWISKLVTICFISTFCWGFFCLFLARMLKSFFGKGKLSFYILTALRLRKYDGFNFLRDHTIEVSRDFLGGAPHPESTPYQFWGPWALQMWRWNVLTWHLSTWSIFHVTL